MFKSLNRGLLPQYCMADGDGDGGGSADTGFVAADGTFNDGWTERPEFKAHAETLSRSKNVTELANSHMELRKKYGKDPNSMVEIPNATSSDEVTAAWRKANGVPDVTDAYEYKLSPELTTKLGPIDDKKMAAVKEFAHKELELSPAKFTKLLDFYHNTTAGEIDTANISFNEKNAAATVAAIAELKQEWKGDYDNNVILAQAVMRKYGGDDAVAEFAAESSPTMLRFLNNISSAMSEDKLRELGAGTGSTSAELNSQIAAVRSEQSKIREGNPVNYKSDPNFKDAEQRLKLLYQKKPT